MMKSNTDEGTKSMKTVEELEAENAKLRETIKREEEINEESDEEIRRLNKKIDELRKDRAFKVDALERENVRLKAERDAILDGLRKELEETVKHRNNTFKMTANYNAVRADLDEVVAERDKLKKLLFRHECG